MDKKPDCIISTDRITMDTFKDIYIEILERAGKEQNPAKQCSIERIAEFVLALGMLLESLNDEVLTLRERYACYTWKMSSRSSWNGHFHYKGIYWGLMDLTAALDHAISQKAVDCTAIHEFTAWTTAWLESYRFPEAINSDGGICSINYLYKLKDRIIKHIKKGKAETLKDAGRTKWI